MAVAEPVAAFAELSAHRRGLAKATRPEEARGARRRGGQPTADLRHAAWHNGRVRTMHNHAAQKGGHGSVWACLEYQVSACTVVNVGSMLAAAGSSLPPTLISCGCGRRSGRGARLVVAPCRPQKSKTHTHRSHDARDVGIGLRSLCMAWDCSPSPSRLDGTAVTVTGQSLKMPGIAVPVTGQSLKMPHAGTAVPVL